MTEDTFHSSFALATLMLTMVPGCPMRMRLVAPLAALLCPLLATLSFAQSAYPNKPVRIVVPYAPGGSVDPIARLVADRLSRTMGQSVFVENRPGAGGNIGIEAVVRGTHDGYTLLATPSGIAVNPSVYSKVPYNLDKDLTPIALVNRNAMIVLVNPKSGINSLADLIARAKEKPGSLNYAISANGTLDHLVCEHLRVSTGVEMVRINYGGVPKAVTALMAGEVQVMVASVVSAASYVKSGQLKPIAVTSSQRLTLAPEAPTMTELGYKNFVMYGWAMLFAPSGVPADIVARLHEETRKVVASPDVTKIITDTGSEVQSLTLDELRAYLRQEAALFAGIAKASGTRID
jgi:tripartite-type tricarboxylate transporter receptor subunit TctC